MSDSLVDTTELEDSTHENGGDAESTEILGDDEAGDQSSDHASQLANASGDETGEDPELEAIKARVREMEEEAEKLKQMQDEVEKQMSMSPPCK